MFENSCHLLTIKYMHQHRVASVWRARQRARIIPRIARRQAADPERTVGASGHCLRTHADATARAVAVQGQRAVQPPHRAAVSRHATHHAVERERRACLVVLLA